MATHTWLLVWIYLGYAGDLSVRIPFAAVKQVPLQSRAVVKLVRAVEHSDEMLAAAWLHDVVEDTKVRLDLIEAEFGVIVHNLVGWLTDISRPVDGNRKARKAIDRQHSADATAAAQTIKVADLIDNSKSIFSLDPDFARTYMQEKEMLLDVLTKADRRLVKIAKQQLEEFTGIIH